MRTLLSSFTLLPGRAAIRSMEASTLGPDIITNRTEETLEIPVGRLAGWNVQIDALFTHVPVIPYRTRCANFTVLAERSLLAADVEISMDGRCCCMDSIFMERFVQTPEKTGFTKTSCRRKGNLTGGGRRNPGRAVFRLVVAQGREPSGGG
ncbi:MAG: hypothetical protein KDF64_04180 [Geminicoccaceae bacterium]|nr:hypothetical protein [Geminicoccaceae bacterium]